MMRIFTCVNRQLIYAKSFETLVIFDSFEDSAYDDAQSFKFAHRLHHHNRQQIIFHALSDTHSKITQLKSIIADKDHRRSHRLRLFAYHKIYF